MDTLTSLRVLDAVAELLSFAAAADRLGLSPAMATKHVQHLETRLGARLLNRTSRSVSVTEAGALYLARMRPLLEGLDEAEAQISSSSVRPSGKLRVSLPVWIASPGFARLLARFHEQCPDVVLELDLSARWINLVEDGFDLAIRVAKSLEPSLIARRLGDIQFRLVASPSFLARHGRPASLADLNGAPFMAYGLVAREGRVQLANGAETTEVAFRPVLISENETLLLHAALEGMGYTIMPHWLVDSELASGTLERVLPLQVNPTVPLFAVYPDRSYLPAKVRSFLDFLAASGFPNLAA